MKICKNENCENEIIGNKKKAFCSDKCRMEFHNKNRISLVGSEEKIDRTSVGAFTLIKAIEFLMKDGYQVYQNNFSNNNIIVAEKYNKLEKMLIRAGWIDSSGNLRYRSAKQNINKILVLHPSQMEFIFIEQELG